MEDSTIRVLVIDSDAASRRLLQAALASEKNWDVTAVRSCDEALAALRNGSGCDLVVTDLSLSQQSGVEVIRHIRETAGYVPVLVLSSIQSDVTVARALALGADDFLQKPVDLRELRRTAASLINRSRNLEEAGMATPDASRQTSIRTVADGTFVELIAPTDALQAERFQRFADRLLSASLNEQDRYNLHLALEEIVRNAIEWGNQHDRDKKLRLSYCMLPDRITFRIEDEGEGFDHSSLKDPSLDPQAHIAERRASGKRMGGWGVFLTRKVMDEVTYNAKGNVVFLTKLLNRGAAPATPAEAAPEAETAERKSKRATRRKKSLRPRSRRCKTTL